MSRLLALAGTAALASAFAATLLLPATAGAQTLAAGGPADNFAWTTHASGLGQLTDFRFLPDGRIVLISKTGEVRVRKTDGTLVSAGSFPVDTGSEKGLLGVEVHPSFATNGTLFFYYSLAAGSGGTDLDKHRVVSVTLKADSTLDLTTQKVLVKDLRGPANHDGGALALSADGTKLFIGVGDTGCNSGKAPEPTYTPTNFFGTCLTNGNGKVLRVNLDGTIPSDNPLVGVAAVTACGATCGTNISTTGTAAPRTDIYAWGFRNPFRLWTDPVTGNLWVGDVGEVTYEEINIVQKGRHHGWPWREGYHGWPITKCNDVTPKGDCREPLHEMVHTTTVKSITGGAIVDDCTWPAAFRGLYFYGDNATNQLWTVQPNATRDGIVAGSQKDFGTVASPVSIRPGPDGALYIASLGGRLVRFAPKAPVTCGTDAGVPDTGPADTGLADTGLADVGLVDTGTLGDSATSTDTGVAADGSVATDAEVADTNAAADTSVATDADVTADSGGAGEDAGEAAGEPASDGSCGCSTPGHATDVGLGALALAGVVVMLSRRARAARRV